MNSRCITDAGQKRYTRSNNTVDFTTVIEYLLVYSKTNSFIVNLLPRTNDADNRYTNPDNDPRGPWKGASFLNPATPSQRPNLCYPITNPNTGEITYNTDHAWRRAKEIFKLTEAQADFLYKKKRNMGIFIIGSNRVFANFLVKDKELKIFGRGGGR